MQLLVEVLQQYDLQRQLDLLCTRTRPTRSTTLRFNSPLSYCPQRN